MTSHILVVGVIRNAGKSLRTDVQRLAAALQRFERISWYIVESDSEDETVAELARLQRENPDFQYATLGNLAEGLPNRTDRIALARNTYLAEIRSNSAYADVEYVAIADLDGLNTLIEAGGVDSCFLRPDWDAVFANQSKRYFDIWALRHPAWCPGDCFDQAEELTRAGFDPESVWALSIGSRQIHIPPTANWIAVESAFGGFGIYRKELLASGSYNGTSGEAPICEHVPFHEALRDAGARLYINPALINAGWVTHTRQHQKWRKPFRALKRASAALRRG